MSLFVATPCYRSDPNDAVAWAARIATELGCTGASVSVEAMCPWIDLAREALVVAFLDSSCTELLFRDDDVDVDAGVVRRMRSALDDAPIVVAPYLKRRRRGEAGVWATEALGCALLRREVIETLVRAHPELAYDVEGRLHVGLFDAMYLRDARGDVVRKLREDGAFLYRARAAGFGVESLDDVVVNHAGEVSHFTRGAAEP